jgi:hypothetical protein
VCRVDIRPAKNDVDAKRRANEDDYLKRRGERDDYSRVMKAAVTVNVGDEVSLQKTQMRRNESKRKRRSSSPTGDDIESRHTSDERSTQDMMMIELTAKLICL